MLIDIAKLECDFFFHFTIIQKIFIVFNNLCSMNEQLLWRMQINFSESHIIFCNKKKYFFRWKINQRVLIKKSVHLFLASCKFFTYWLKYVVNFRDEMIGSAFSGQLFNQHQTWRFSNKVVALNKQKWMGYFLFFRWWWWWWRRRRPRHLQLMWCDRLNWDRWPHTKWMSLKRTD